MNLFPLGQIARVSLQTLWRQIGFVLIGVKRHLHKHCTALCGKRQQKIWYLLAISQVTISIHDRVPASSGYSSSDYYLSPRNAAQRTAQRV